MTPGGGRPPGHGGEFTYGDRATWGSAQAVTVTNTRLCGRAMAQARDRQHPRPTRQAARIDHDGPRGNPGHEGGRQRAAQPRSG